MQVAHGGAMTISATTAVLLGQDEPKPFQVQGGDSLSPFVILCDHAGQRLPRALGSLGLSQAQLQSHIAWDIGAMAVAHRLGTLLNAVVFSQPYSRLVIDCNRPLKAPDSIATASELTTIPGNQGLSAEEAVLRAREIFHPYHDQVRAELDRRVRAHRSTVLVAFHSFTPVFKGVARPWHVGVLFNRDQRLATTLLRALQAEPGLVVGCNQPYEASEASDYSLIQHGEKRGTPCVEIEVRQDLISNESDQMAWAERLARLLRAINLLQL